MLLDIEHRLAFEYDSLISESFLELRVEPRSDGHQTLHSFVLAVGPPTRVHRYSDWNGNRVHHFSITEFHDRIEVLARSLVRSQPARLPLEAATEAPRAAEACGGLRDFLAFGGPVRRSARLVELHEALPVAASAPLGEQVRTIGDLLGQRFRYRPEVTDYRSSSDEILEHGGGVCQDFAHLMLALLRLRGIPSRYVSGYLHVERPEAEPAQSHAWLEFHTAAHGWIGFDPTHRRLPDERYVTVGHGRSYDDVPPNRGIFKGNARERLRAEVHTRLSPRRDVTSLHEEIASIDLPVYREIPERLRSPRAAVLGPEDGQQQQ